MNMALGRKEERNGCWISSIALSSLVLWKGRETGRGLLKSIFLSPQNAFLLFSVGPKALEGSIQILSREGNKTGTCALVELLRISSSFWHSLMQRQGKNSPRRELLLQFAPAGGGGEEVNESWEKELSLVLLPPPKLTNRMASGACRSPGKYSAMMKTISYPIITAAEGSENASASIRNQNSFFGAALALSPVSFDGCTADTASRRLLKYSLQRAGVKQLHTPTPLTHLD